MDNSTLRRRKEGKRDREEQRATYLTGLCKWLTEQRWRVRAKSQTSDLQTTGSCGLPWSLRFWRDKEEKNQLRLSQIFTLRIINLFVSSNGPYRNCRSENFTIFKKTAQRTMSCHNRKNRSISTQCNRQQECLARIIIWVWSSLDVTYFRSCVTSKRSKLSWHNWLNKQFN